MKADRHETIRELIDKALAGAATSQEQKSLGDHIEGCTQCREYLSSGSRAIAGLNGFSFGVDPALQQKICLALSRRAVQLEVRPPSRRRLAWVCVITLLLTIAGSVLDLKFGSVAAAWLGIQPALVRHDLLHVWVLPSLSFCLLIPALLALSATGAKQSGMNQKGTAL